MALWATLSILFFLLHACDGDQPASSTTNSKSGGGLSRGAIIGIAVGVGIPVLIGIMLLIFLCLRNGWYKRGSKSSLVSPLDSRFGSKTISSPNHGAYGNPYASHPMEVKEITTFAFTSEGSPPEQPAFKLGSIPKDRSLKRQMRLDTKKHTRNAPSDGSSIMPIHHAYIPTAPYPASPASATSTIAPLSFSPTFTSPKSSPSYTPTLQSPNIVSPSSEFSRIYTPSLHSSRNRYQPQESPLTYNPNSPQEAPESSPPLSSRTQPRSRSHSQPRPPSRSNSLIKTRDRSTLLVGLGGSNASQEQPIRRVSGPILHTDLNHAEKEKQAETGNKGVGKKWGGKAEDVSPADSEGIEQWPGSY